MAYSESTHEEITENAIRASALFREPTLLARYGLKQFTQAETFPDSEGTRRSILELLRRGARVEDKFPRSLHHFYNPINGEALSLAGTVVGSTSPDWALEDKAQIGGGFVSGGQEYSYRDARLYFLRGLTAVSKAERDRNFGLTFQSLGQIVHHLQDMAQPQHVRNDQHLELDGVKEAVLCATVQIACQFYLRLKNPSLYEEYTVKKQLSLTYTGYEPVYSKSRSDAFSTPRAFWHTMERFPSLGKGLAEFTNQNFFSSGTNLDKVTMFGMPYEKSRYDVDIKALVPNTSLQGSVTFITSDVIDNLTGQTATNPLASTLSIFDADLEEKGARPVYSLNRFNFDTQHHFLIPRAVGYSAGLINYFFRTEFDVEQVGLSNNYLIRNTTSEPMQGELTVYFDQSHYSGTQRNPVPGGTWTVSIPAGGSQQLLFSSQGIPFGPTSTVPHVLQKEFMAVFQGTHGSEQPANGNLGAVSGRRFARCFPNGDEASFEKTLTDPVTGARYDLSVFGLLRYGYANSSTWVIRAGGRTHQFAVPAYVHNVALGIPRNGRGPDTFTENLFDQGSPLGPDNDISYLLIGLPSSFDENDPIEVEMPCP